MSKVLKSYRFDKNTIELIEQLKVALHLENNSAVLRRGIALLNVICEAKKNGEKLVLKNSDGEREIIL